MRALSQALDCFQNCFRDRNHYTPIHSEPSTPTRSRVSSTVSNTQKGVTTGIGTYSREGNDFFLKRTNGKTYPADPYFLKRYENMAKGFYLLKFTERSLEEIKKYYKKQFVPAAFLKRFLEGEPSQDRDSMLHHPKHYEFVGRDNKSNEGFIIMPNSSYMEYDNAPVNRKETPEKFKDTQKGVALTAWFMSGDLLKTETGQAIIDEDAKADLRRKYEAINAKDQDALRYGEEGTEERKTSEEERRKTGKYGSHSSLDKLGAQTTVENIEKTTGRRFLASILDLIPDDVPLLKKLGEKTKDHLKRNYGFNDNNIDDVHLYFHFPYPDSTVGLHLHARNKVNNPIDEARSFSLDDIIERLEKGDTIEDMIMERNTSPDLDGLVLCDKKGDLFKLLEACPSLKKSKIDNPKLMTPLLSELS